MCLVEEGLRSTSTAFPSGIGALGADAAALGRTLAAVEDPFMDPLSDVGDGDGNARIVEVAAAEIRTYRTEGIVTQLDRSSRPPHKTPSDFGEGYRKEEPPAAGGDSAVPGPFPSNDHPPISISRTKLVYARSGLRLSY